METNVIVNLLIYFTLSAIAATWIAVLMVALVSRHSARKYKSKISLEDVTSSLVANDDATEVWLVHGTWSKGAKWTDADSRICSHLKKYFINKGHQLIIRRFNWNGQNSMRAREDASSVLSEKIIRHATLNRGGRLAIIGHSHGGTVALNALESSWGSADKEGQQVIEDHITLFCLASPLLISTPGVASPSNTALWRRLDDAFVTAGLLTLLLIPYWLLPGNSTGAAITDVIRDIAMDFDIHVGELWLAMSCLFVAVMLGVYLLRKLIYLPSVDRAISNEVKVRCRIHFIKCAGDEAQHALAAMFMVSRSINIVTSLVFGMTRVIHGNIRRRLKYWSDFLGIAGLIALAFSGVAFWGSLESGLIAVFASISFILFMMCFSLKLAAGVSIPEIIGWLASLVTIPVMLPLRMISALPYGAELAALGSWRLACIEHAPIGAWNLVVLDSPEVRHDSIPDWADDEINLDEGDPQIQRSLLNLSHSQVYEHRYCIGYLCRTIG